MMHHMIGYVRITPHVSLAAAGFLACSFCEPLALPLGARQLLLLVGGRKDAEERVHALLGRHTWQRCGVEVRLVGRATAAGDETQPANALFAFFSFSMPRITRSGLKPLSSIRNARSLEQHEPAANNITTTRGDEYEVSGKGWLVERTSLHPCRPI